MFPSFRRQAALGCNASCSMYWVRHKHDLSSIVLIPSCEKSRSLSQLIQSLTCALVACTSFIGVIIGASVATSSETAAKVLGAINAGCFIYLGPLIPHVLASTQLALINFNSFPGFRLAIRHVIPKLSTLVEIPLHFLVFNGEFTQQQAQPMLLCLLVLAFLLTPSWQLVGFQCSS